MNQIYLSYPEIESMNVCPIGHPLISTLIYGKEKSAIFHEKRRNKLYGQPVRLVKRLTMNFIISTTKYNKER